MLKHFRLPALASLLVVFAFSNSAQAEVLYSTNFDSGLLGAEWSSPFASTTRGVTAIRELPSGGSKALSMEIKGAGTAISNLNSIDLAVNLSQHTGVSMSFDHYVFMDSVDTYPNSSSFQGQSNFDGIAISSNNLNWFPIWSPTTTGLGIWESGTVLDISAAIASIASPNLTHSGAFKIRFQQYGSVDNGSLSNDGRGFDNISISGTRLPGLVPEPSSAALLGIGFVCSLLAGGRRRRGSVR